MSIGGIKDLRSLFSLLNSSKRNHMDNGQIHEAAEPETEQSGIEMPANAKRN
jgi:hypothetical protein